MPLRFTLRLLLCMVCLALAPGLRAQIVDDPTSWSYEVKKTGDNTYRLIFHCKLTKPDWHIYSLKPGGDGTLIPPSFSIDKNPAVTLKGGVKEEGKRLKQPDEVVGDYYYFKGKVDFVQDVTVTANTTITGKHTYQVCDESMCLPPKTLKFSFKISDVSPKADTSNTTGSVTDAPSDTVAKTDEPAIDTGMLRGVAPAATASGNDTTTGMAATGTTDLDSRKSSFSELGLFLTGLGSGIVSVITPCVFAMLPMTVSFFLKRSKDRKTGIRIALQYSLSIVFIFTVIGGLISILAGPDALHAFSTNWVINLLFFAIFFIFGISFLGAFEINLPSSWATKLDSKANTQSFIGIFFMALTLVVVSFSCTGPFIGNMLAAMSAGGKVGPLIGFLGYGLGLALPFSLFAIFPSWLNALGKGGSWLNSVKVTFGFIELALAMKFLSNADLDRGWRMLDREIFVAIWAVLSLGLGLYLLGMIRFSHDSELPKNDWGLPYLKVPRLLLGISALVFALYLIPGMWGAPLRGMGAFVPPMGTQDFAITTGGIGGHVAAGPASSEPRKYAERMKLYEPAAVLNAGLDVYYDYDEALVAAKAAGKPLLLDFTGIQCVNCRKFEAEVWSDPTVMSMMKNDFIIASLYTDAHNVPLQGEAKRFSDAANKDIETLADKNVDLQISKFKANTQPYYFFVDGDGRQLAAQGVGYPTKPKDFIRHMELVKQRYEELNGEGATAMTP